MHTTSSVKFNKLAKPARVEGKISLDCRGGQAPQCSTQPTELLCPKECVDPIGV